MAYYIVTGCAGFIGSRVTELLFKFNKRNFVIGIDNLYPAYDVRLKDWRLARLHTQPNFTFHRLNICEKKALYKLRRYLSKLKFDAVIHLAAQTGVHASVSNPQLYYETNVLGTLNILDLCRELRIRKLILASTSSLYGADTPLPFREDAKTDTPLSPYAASKKAAEELCYVYHHLYGLDITVLRYFTVYGPAGRPDMSIFRFVQNIIEGLPITIYGDGTQTRGFTYIDDIAQGTIAALPLKGYEIVNLGGSQAVSLHTVIQVIERLTGRKAVIDYRPRHPADVAATQADCSKAMRLLKWIPQITLEEGLQATIDWYEANRDWLKRLG